MSKIQGGTEHEEETGGSVTVQQQWQCLCLQDAEAVTARVVMQTARRLQKVRRIVIRRQQTRWQT